MNPFQRLRQWLHRRRQLSHQRARLRAALRPARLLASLLPLLTSLPGTPPALRRRPGWGALRFMGFTARLMDRMGSALWTRPRWERLKLRLLWTPLSNLACVFLRILLEKLQKQEPRWPSNGP